MKIRTQIIIDKYFIQALAIILNIATRIIGKIFRINHSLDRDFKRIAICKYKGLGSIIQATPLIDALKQKYPQAEIIFVSSIQNETILKKIQLIDSYILINDKSFFRVLISFPGFLLRLMRKRIQLYFDLEIYSNFSSIITTCSLSTNRIGFYLRSSNYRMGIYSHMIFYNMRIPIQEVYLQMARLLNIEEKEYNLYKLPIEEDTLILDHQKEFNIQNEEYIIINPNASDLRVERRWSSDSIVSLINMLSIKYPGVFILLIGSKAERDYTQAIYNRTDKNKKILNLAGRTSINQLIALIGNAKVMITNDTGPMHIGFSLNAPIVALFGPCMPTQYGNHPNSISIYKNVYCSPCVHEFIIPPCHGNNTCMKLITTEDVLNATDTILQGNIQEFILNSEVCYLSSGDTLGVVSRASSK